MIMQENVVLLSRICDGAIVAQLFNENNGGNETFKECIDVPSAYSIEITDAYGDGWNGGILDT